MVFLPDRSCKYLEDLYCIELRDFDQDRPKGAKRRGYTKNPMVWDRYPPRWDRYGVLLAPNNLLVVDIDYPDKKSYKEFPPTFTVKSGGGGFHLYYWNIDDLPSNHSVEWGEIKTTGHVCGVGVIHGSGKKYKVVENIPIVPIEKEELTEILTEPQPQPDNSGNPPPRSPPNHVNSSNCQDLHFVKSEEKRQKILKILKDPDAPHNDRLWLVGFLDYIGIAVHGILSIIDQHNSWSDYDKGTTRNQVKSVLKSKKGGDTFE